jgi:hypothetical protein
VYTNSVSSDLAGKTPGLADIEDERDAVDGEDRSLRRAEPDMQLMRKAMSPVISSGSNGFSTGNLGRPLTSDCCRHDDHDEERDPRDRPDQMTAQPARP